MQWVKTLTVSICIMTIISQLIPQEKYAKYVRFYSGFIFLLIVINPVLKFFSVQTEFADYLKIEFIKEEYSELERKADSLADLKMEQIQTSLEKESSRQIQMLASAYGFKNAKVSIRYGEDFTVSDIELWVSEAQSCTDLQKEIKALFSAETVTVHRLEGSGGKYEEMDQ